MEMNEDNNTLVAPPVGCEELSEADFEALGTDFMLGPPPTTDDEGEIPAPPESPRATTVKKTSNKPKAKKVDTVMSVGVVEPPKLLKRKVEEPVVILPTEEEDEEVVMVTAAAPKAKKAKKEESSEVSKKKPTPKPKTTKNASLDAKLPICGRCHQSMSELLFTCPGKECNHCTWCRKCAQEALQGNSAVYCSCSRPITLLNIYPYLKDKEVRFSISIEALMRMFQPSVSTVKLLRTSFSEEKVEQLNKALAEKQGLEERAEELKIMLDEVKIKLAQRVQQVCKLESERSWSKRSAEMMKVWGTLILPGENKTDQWNVWSKDEWDAAVNATYHMECNLANDQNNDPNVSLINGTFLMRCANIHCCGWVNTETKRCSQGCEVSVNANYQPCSLCATAMSPQQTNCAHCHKPAGEVGGWNGPRTLFPMRWCHTVAPTYFHMQSTDEEDLDVVTQTLVEEQCRKYWHCTEEEEQWLLTVCTNMEELSEVYRNHLMLKISFKAFHKWIQLIGQFEDSRERMHRELCSPLYDYGHPTQMENTRYRSLIESDGVATEVINRLLYALAVGDQIMEAAAKLSLVIRTANSFETVQSEVSAIHTLVLGSEWKTRSLKFGKTVKSPLVNDQLQFIAPLCDFHY